LSTYIIICWEISEWIACKLVERLVCTHKDYIMLYNNFIIIIDEVHRYSIYIILRVVQYCCRCRLADVGRRCIGHILIVSCRTSVNRALFGRTPLRRGMQFGRNPPRPGMQCGHSNWCLFFGMQFGRIGGSSNIQGVQKITKRYACPKAGPKERLAETNIGCPHRRSQRVYIASLRTALITPLIVSGTAWFVCYKSSVFFFFFLTITITTRTAMFITVYNNL
jgi:hypothetical protein